jgi:thiol-disulfide isomerase/thioredoxin
MKHCVCSVALPFVVFSLAGFSAAQVNNSELAPAEVLQSVRGKVAVLIFVRSDCPVSNRYAPTIQQISARNAGDTNFFLVFPDKSQSSAIIQKYAADFGYKFPAVKDPQHLLVKRAYAKFTPEAAVFDRKGDLVYHGRIDDLYDTIARTRPAPTTHELEDAIRAALAGHAPARSHVEGVGCYISDLQ